MCSVGQISLTRGSRRRRRTKSAPIEDEFLVTLPSNVPEASGSETGHRDTRLGSRDRGDWMARGRRR